MVDFLGHAGHLQEAENLVMAMPCKQQVAAWMALLGACRIHGNVEMAEHIAKQILEMEPENAAAYVLLSSIYAAAGNRHLHTSIVFRYIAQVRTGSRYARMYVFKWGCGSSDTARYVYILITLKYSIRFLLIEFSYNQIEHFIIPKKLSPNLWIIGHLVVVAHSVKML